MQSSHQRNWQIKLLLFCFFGDLMFFYPFYNLILISNGLSKANVCVVLITMQCGKMLFDIPSGILADKYDRRGILILSQLLRLTMLLMWAILPCKATFLIGMFLFGVSISCLFGNIESYVYDLMDDKSRNATFPRLIGLIYAVQSIAIAISSFVGAILIHSWGTIHILIASIVSTVVSLCISLSLPKYKNITAKCKSSISTILSSAINALKAEQIKPYILFSIMHDALFIFCLDLNTMTMIDMGLKGEVIAMICGTITAIKIFANFIAGYTAAYITDYMIYLVDIVLFSGLIYCGRNYNSGLLYVIGTILIVLSFSDITIKSRLQKYINKNIRTAIMSGSGILVSANVICFNLLYNGIGAKYGYNIACSAIGIICIANITTIIYFLQNKTQANTKIQNQSS